MAAPPIPVSEVDDNLNVVSFEDEPLHKQEPDPHHWLTQCSLKCYWKRLEREWAANPTKPDVVNAFRVIHIKETDWDLLLEDEVNDDEVDEDPEGAEDGVLDDEAKEKRQSELVKIAVAYWQKLIRFCKDHGSKVEFLTIHLQETEGCDLDCAIESLKISFMTSLPEMFPNLTGLKLVGNGLGDISDGNLDIINQASQKDWQLPIVSLDFEHRVSMGYLGLTGLDLIKGCSNYLKELHVSHVQISKNPVGVVLSQVAKLTLRKFGGEVSTSGEWFRVRISTLMPNLKSLAIEKTFNDFVNGLGALVNHLVETTGLQSLSVTMDGRHYSEEGDTKIGSLHTLKLVLSPFGSNTLAIFDIIPEVTQLVVANIEKSDITEDRLLSLLSDRGVRYESIRFIK